MTKRSPQLIISLDFELMWGVRDHRSIQNYGKSILGARAAIPCMLDLFEKYEVRATWAAVGMLLFSNKKDLMNNIPSMRPSYSHSTLNPYETISNIGANEKEDPYHFALSLAKQIVDAEGMELGSHTFSHYYCLEEGQSNEQFEADLAAAVSANYGVAGIRPKSLVFPRNQYNQTYLPICKNLGFTCFRGNEKSWIYSKAEKKDSLLKRLSRLSDVYFNFTGNNNFIPQEVSGLINIPSSRYLRKYSPILKSIEYFKLLRITRAMTAAAISGECFHLWWHPHDFGLNHQKNLAVLEVILQHYAYCRDTYGMVSLNMGNISEQCRLNTETGGGV